MRAVSAKLTNGRYFPRASTARTRRRRRPTLVSRNARRRPTRRNNRRSILRNSRVIQRLSRIQKSHMVFCDWWMSESIPHTYRQWHCTPLVNPTAWANIMRQNIDVLTENSTYMRSGTLNIYTQLTNSQAAVTWNIFLVRLRKNYANTDLTDVVNNIGPTPTPPIPYWSNTQSWIRGQAYGKITLNSGLVKVIKHWYYTLSDNRLESTYSGDPTQAGTPTSTWRRLQCRIPLNQKVNGQQAFSWKVLNDRNIPYYNQVYLLACPDCADQQATNALQYDFLASTVNYD